MYDDGQCRDCRKHISHNLLARYFVACWVVAYTFLSFDAAARVAQVSVDDDVANEAQREGLGYG